MKTRKVIGIVLCILLSALLLARAGAARELTKLDVLADPLLWGPSPYGTPEEAIIIAGFQIIPDNKWPDKTMKIELIQYFVDKMAEAGYTFEWQYWSRYRNWVEYQNRGWGWLEDLIQKERDAFLAGRGPDIILGRTQMPDFAASGYLEPFPEYLAEKIREIAVPGAYLPMTIKGKIYGIAPYPSPIILLWNKEHLRRAGLDPEVGPRTWSEWLEMANKVTEAGKGEFYGGGVFAGPYSGGSGRVFPFMMMTPGGGFFDENDNINFTHYGNIRALKFIRELNKNLPPEAAEVRDAATFGLVFNTLGRICFGVGASWQYSQAREAGIDIGCGLLPIPDGHGRRVNVTSGIFFAVPKYSENKEGAFKYIMTFLDEYVQERSLPMLKRPCVLKSWGEDPQNQKGFYYTVWLALQNQVVGLPAYYKQTEVWDIFHQYMTKAITTDVDIEEVMAEAQRQAEKVLQ